jgi:hypothetical protein
VIFILGFIFDVCRSIHAATRSRFAATFSAQKGGGESIFVVESAHIGQRRIVIDTTNDRNQRTAQPDR